MLPLPAFHERLQSILAYLAGDEHDDLAGGVVEIGRGEEIHRADLAVDAVGITTRAASDGDDFQVVVLGGGTDGTFLGAIVEADADHHEISVLVQRIEGRRLGPTQRTPGRPEIHQHPFATVVGQMQCLAVDLGELEVDGFLGEDRLRNERDQGK